MTGEITKQRNNERPKRFLDIPFIIKVVILIFLFLLLIVEISNGEFSRLQSIRSKAALILFLKSFLIALVLWLIQVQKDLKCQITAPKNCVKEQTDIPNGRLFVKVQGTASGFAFGHYILEVMQDGGLPIPDIVIYPGGTASGTARVVDAELGRINTIALSDGAYTVRLTVYPAGSGSPKACTTTFNLLKVLVLIDSVGEIPVLSMAPVLDNHNPLDPACELRKEYAASPPPHDHRLVAVAGSISINGMAYVYGCEDRKVSKYEIRYDRVTTPGGEPAQPPNLTSIPANWQISNRIVEVIYSSDKYMPWTKAGPAPINLINKWGEFTFWGATFPRLEEYKWPTSNIESGRYSLLLTVEDSLGFQYHDLQHVWFDNFWVHGCITGVTGVKPCADLLLSQFVSKPYMDIQGYAWDSIIDTAFPVSAPNDNFDFYRLTLYKQGGGEHLIGTYSSRVIKPMRYSGPAPTESEADSLASFNIATIIDADHPGSDPKVSIPREGTCAYYLLLEVVDTTRLNDDSSVHYVSSIWPFCIKNDLKS